MRRLTFFTIATVFLGASALTSISAFAADAGTYRPGNAYHSISSGSPDVCEMQCSGDAQCRSWNFVRASKMAEGVCEFNENLSSPIPSAISISGNNVSRARSARVIAGNTNTVRVGAPSVTQPPAQMQAQTQPTRRIVRQRPTQAINTQAASYRGQKAPAYTSRNAGQQTAPNSMMMPRTAPAVSQFRHSLEEGSSRPSVAAPQRPIPRNVPRQSPRTQAPSAYAHADPRLKRQLQQRIQPAPNSNANQRPATPATQSHPTYAPKTAPSSYASAGDGLSAPPGVPPLAPQAPAAVAAQSYYSPSMAGAPVPAAPRRVTIPSELSPRAMGTANSLFGSLYDDVKVPRPIDPRLAADPDSPIPTVSSVPVANISNGALPPIR